MISQRCVLNSFRWLGRSKKAACVGLFAGLSAVSFSAQAQTFDGPSFPKGMWKFERSLEVSSRNAAMPNTKHVRVEPPVTRCVDPTEAMKETFRPVNIGSCHSTPPEKIKNGYHFARRCDYLGPVKTTISIESETAYRETNEITVGRSPKKETVVARRIGDCAIVELGTHPTSYDKDDPSSYYPPVPKSGREF